MAFEGDDYKGTSTSTGIGSAAAALRAAAIQAAKSQAAARRVAQQVQRPAVAPRVTQPIRRSDDFREDRPEFTKPAPPIDMINMVASANQPAFRPTPAPAGQSFADWREERPEFNPSLVSSAETVRSVKSMLEDIDRDPLRDPEKSAAAIALADQFKATTRRYVQRDELKGNPLLRVLSEMATWSQYRRKVADWYASDRKTGGGEVSLEEGSDGTYTGLSEGESFSSVTSPSNLPPYIVSRDESGMLTVMSVDKWLQGKFTDMRKNPAYAGQVITALALMSDYGTDSSANSQASRLVTDKNGNVVKALVDTEDLSALKRFANKVAIWQNNGDESAIEDVLEEMTKLGAEVSARNGANGEHGGGGGGGYYRGGGGGGYGGGGGGAVQTRYTDATELGSVLDSIGRQRIGRSMTPEERAAFVQYFHQLEEQTSAAYAAGQSYTMLSAEGQAIEWITSRFGGEAGKQMSGNFFVDFMKLMGSDNPFGSMS